MPLAIPSLLEIFKSPNPLGLELQALYDDG
jgi:hypothetical protein